MEMEELSTEFANTMSPHFNILRISDLLLFGSTARAILNGFYHKKPADVDILILHNNPIFDDYQRNVQKIDDSILSDNEKCRELGLQLVKEGYTIPDLYSVPIIKKGLLENKLNISFLNQKFFSNSDYRAEMKSLNHDPEFYSNIFREGLLYNPKTKNFDRKITYALPRDF